MQITFICSNCQTNLEIDANNIGSDIECPSCSVVTTVPRQEPGPGTTIGGFYIRSLIGVGGMGNVFLATQLSMDRDVALKVLSAAVTRDPEDLERFMNEVRLTAKLEHQNIVSAYEAGEDAGYYYMAMAYVNGMPLDKRIQKNNNHRLEEKESLRITKKIALALSYAWNEHGMLHRDVKPENILLDAKGEPKLADFGLSRAHKQSKRITSHGAIMGTPNYMSPEQMDNLSNADKRSDIYSLGASLYQMLTGKIPFDDENDLKTFKLIAKESLPDPRKYNPKISLSCMILLEKMLARDPSNRYQMWNKVVSDLSLVLSGKGITTPRLSRGESVVDVVVLTKNKKNVSPIKKARRLPRVIKALVTTAVILSLVVLAIGWIKNNPDLRQKLLSKLNVEKKVKAEQKIDFTEVNDNRNIEADNVWNTLRMEALEAFKAGDANKSIDVLHSYNGEYIAEIKDRRDKLVAKLEKYIKKHNK